MTQVAEKDGIAMQRTTTSERMSRGEVAAVLRRRIISGCYAPGAQIPTREKLATMLGASYVTIQRGLDRLRDEGFVRSRRGSGTFVVDHPPHTCRYALVLPSNESDTRLASSHFLELLIAEAGQVVRELAPKHVEVWFDVDAHEDNPRYVRLLEQARQRCLAGLIFPNEPFRLRGSALLQQPGIGLALIGEVSEDMPFMAGVRPHIRHFLNRACAELAVQGRKRLAAFCPPLIPTLDRAYLPDSVAAAAAAHGLSTRPSCLLPMNALNSEGIGRAMTLLMELSPGQRPDALILLDDHMVEPATQALCQCGISVPRDLGIIAYANFPTRPKAHVPVRYLGFDIRHMLRKMLPLIDAQVAGVAIPRLSLHPAIFEEELPYS